MPRFHDDYLSGGDDISEALKGMGLVDAFVPNDANFSKMFDKNTYIDSIIHAANIDVTERGTSAAATTLLAMAYGSAVPKFVQIVLDRPFVYMIVDSNGLPIFVGVINAL
jgi:serpin B